MSPSSGEEGDSAYFLWQCAVLSPAKSNLPSPPPKKGRGLSPSRGGVPPSPLWGVGPPPPCFHWGWGYCPHPTRPRPIYFYPPIQVGTLPQPPPKGVGCYPLMSSGMGCITGFTPFKDFFPLLQPESHIRCPLPPKKIYFVSRFFFFSPPTA